MARALTIPLLLAAAISGTGCVASAVGAGEEPNVTFDLVTPAAIGDISPTRGVQVLVAEPSALGVLASQRVLVRVGPREVQYLSDARYTDTLTRLTQFKLKRTLESAQGIGAAALPGEGLAIDYQIITDIRAFEIRVGDGTTIVAGPTTIQAARSAFISLTVKILDDRSGNVVASRVFDSSAPVGPLTGENVGDAYLAALDQALDLALVDIRSFISSRV